MEGVRNFWQNANAGIKSLVIIASLVFIVAIAAFIISLIPEEQFDSRVTVENFGEVANLPKGYKKYIQDNIGNILKENSIVDASETANAVVREGSYSESEKNGARTAEFIVDIENLRQSFAVTVVWAASTSADQEKIEDPNVTIECPYYLDVIYTDTKCLAQAPEQQIKRYLPHYDYAGEVKYAVDLKKYADQMYLQVEIPSCGDSSLRESAVEGTKKWLKSRYLDPNDYKIETMDVCRR